MLDPMRLPHLPHHTPTPMDVATSAQKMANAAGKDRLAVAFQGVALVSVAIMGAASAVQMLQQLRRGGRDRER